MSTSSTPATVGFIGLGQIGGSLATRLLDQGHQLLVWNRTVTRSEALAEQFPGRVRIADSPRALALQVERLILCMLDDQAVRAVMEGMEGALAGLRPGAFILNFTTAHPGLSEQMAALAEANGSGYLDCPFSGGAIQAAAGTLTLMVGGAPAYFEQAKPLLDDCGNRVFHLGAAGSGSMAKMLNNALAFTCLAASAEAMVAGRTAGLDAGVFLQLLLASSGSNFMLERMHGALLQPRRGRVEETFSLRRSREYTRVPVQLAAERGLPQTVVAAADAVFRRSIEAGLGDEHFSAFAVGIQPESEWPV